MLVRTLRLSLLLAALGCATAADAGAITMPAGPPPEQNGPLPNLTGCDSLDPSACMLPFPNDYFTRPAMTATGRRVNFALQGMPRNLLGLPIQPAEWNRLDGFSPGSMIVTKVPGLDNAAAFANTGAATISSIDKSLSPTAPIVIIDAATGERQLYWSELDYSIGTGSDTDASRDLLIRPGKNFLEGHRYIVALRNLKDTAGKVIPAQATFAAFRDRTKLSNPIDNERRAHFESVFASLQAAGIDRAGLYLAWDFTVASPQSIAGRMLAIRNDAFHQLGDDNLADMKVAGKAPAFRVTRIVDRLCPVRAALTSAGLPDVPDPVITDIDCGKDGDSRIAKDIKGTMDVPCYLDTPMCLPVHSNFILNPTTGLPVRIPGNVMKVDFECLIPKVAYDHPGTSRPSLYGHGLFGGYGEIHQDQIHGMTAEHNFIYCATAWAGMAAEDVPNVATILEDLSSFNTLADRVQQGMLNFLYLGRLMIHPAGLVTQKAFQDASGKPLIDTRRLFYDGNSQGGIVGGALTAIAPDFNRATLGVLGMNYSTLLTRSTDFGTGKAPPVVADPSPATIQSTINDPTDGLEYAYPLYTSYPNLKERQLIFDLMQMLWDRAEPDGYAQHMTTDPYPNTPQHRVLLMAGYGDHQVSNYAAEVEARTIGACVLKTDMLPAGRYWGHLPYYGLPTVAQCTKDRGGDEPSVFTVWDGGSRPSPIINFPQDRSRDDDPHEWVRRTPWAREMKSDFLALDSRVVDTCGSGHPCLTYNYPFASDTAVLKPPM